MLNQKTNNWTLLLRCRQNLSLTRGKAHIIRHETGQTWHESWTETKDTTWQPGKGMETEGCLNSRWSTQVEFIRWLIAGENRCWNKETRAGTENDFQWWNDLPISARSAASHFQKPAENIALPHLSLPLNLFLHLKTLKENCTCSLLLLDTSVFLDDQIWHRWVDFGSSKIWWDCFIFKMSLLRFQSLWAINHSRYSIGWQVHSSAAGFTSSGVGWFK